MSSSILVYCGRACSQIIGVGVTEIDELVLNCLRDLRALDH
jgi:hypothetical protein